VLTAVYQPDILVFNPDSAPPWLVELGKTKEWRPVYLDECSVIYLRKGYAPEVPELDAALVLAQRGISPGIRREAGTLIQTPRTPAWKSLVEGFYRSERYSLGLKTIGAYFMNTGKFDEAEAVFLENIRRSQGRYYDLFISPASLYNRTGRMQEAQMCLKRIFQDVPRESVERPKKRFHRP
jgi:tetratricopeptide (TPR) repeat protein